MSDQYLTPAANLDHVIRPPLPWRDDHQTECGLPANSFPTLTRDELADRVKQLGRRRTAMTVCMVCFDTSGRWPTWDEDPVRSIGRETFRRPGSEQFRCELLAIAALVAEHRDEFDGLVRGISKTTPIRSRRARR